MIDGIWWLVILLAIVIALWIVAKARDDQTESNAKTVSTLNTDIATNDALQKTLKLAKQHLPDYRTTRNGQHLLLTKEGKKMAMITIDKKIAAGQRRLGEVAIINYHRVPNRAQLIANVQEVD